MGNIKLVSLLKALTIILIVSLSINFALKYNLFDLLLNLITTLFPFFIALFIAWLMKPLGSFIHTKTKIPLKYSNLLAILINLIIVVAFLFVFIPVFIMQLASLIRISPELIKDINQNIDSTVNFVRDNQQHIKDAYYNILDYLKENADSINIGEISKTLLNTLYQFIIAVGTTLFNSLIGFILFIGQIVVAYIIAFYFVNDINAFIDSLLKFLLRSKYKTYRPVILEMSQTLFSYLRGLVIDCTLLAIIISIWCYFLGIPSPVFFGIVAGIFNIIPYLGPILGGIPIFIAALSQSLLIAVVSAILVLITQTFEANILQPRIMANAVNLHPVSIIVGLLIFGTMFGFVGMIIATPTLAMINVILLNSKYDIHL